MKKIAALIILLSFVSNLMGQGNPKYKTEYTGFFSSRYVIREDNSEFSFGALEIDIARKLSDRFSLEGALAVENGSASVEGFLSMSLSNNSRMKMGRFDLPFGYEYRIADPHINKFESLSIVTTNLVGQVWNNEGVNFNTRFSSFELNGYVINSDASHKMGGIQLINHSLQPLEAGFSISSIMEKNRIDQEVISNVYGKLSLAEFEIVGEFTSSQTTSGINTSQEGLGYYVHSLYELKQIELPVYLGARYGYIDFENADNTYRISAGLGYKITETNLVKVFYRNREGNSSLVLETGVSF